MSSLGVAGSVYFERCGETLLGRPLRFPDSDKVNFEGAGSLSPGRMQTRSC